MIRIKAKEVKKVWAEFIGWQNDPSGDHFPLYNIYGDHYYKGSTVGTVTLQREQIEIPPTPPCPWGF